MKIALLAHALRMGGGLSVGKNLIGALGQVAPDERYLISVPGGIGYETVCGRLPNREVITLPHDHNKLQRWKFDRRLLPGVLNKFQPDVVVGMASLGYQGKNNFAQAILLHNPYLLYPRRNFGRGIGGRELFDNYLKRRVFSRDLRTTGLLFTQTQAAADLVRGRYNYRGKYVTLPNAVSEFTRSGEPSETPPQAVRPYDNRFKLFYLTRYYPHKNLEVLVDLFDRYRDELAGTVVFITVTEDQHPSVSRLLKSIRDRNLEGMIVNIGPLPQAELANYFRHMDGLLMPTLMESFSGTYLEAMHFGLPIITSDLDFAHEVCGEAALYSDPWDITSIKEAVIRLRNDPKLRSSLVSAGRERLANRFSVWDKVAERFIVGLRDIASNSGG